MKLYNLNGQVYQEPLPKGFDLVNAVEITSPIREDGTIWTSHPNKTILSVKTDGSYYAYYNLDGTANLAKEQEIDTAQAIAHFKSMYLGIFNAKLKELDYDSIATVQLWMSDATFGVEATKIMTWYKALITKNYVILNEAKASGVIPTDEEYLIEIAKVVF